MPSFKGKVVLVTGANEGLGKGTASLLAEHGADKVILACRTPSKCSAAAQEIAKSKAPTTVLSTVQVDLSSLSSTQAFIKKIQQSEARIDLLVLNAGVMATPYTITEDGIEIQFQVNHVAQYLVARELKGLLLKSKQPRIVFVSSLASHLGTSLYPMLDLAKLNDEETYDAGNHYHYSKLANVITSNYFDRVVKGSKFRFLLNVKS